MYNYGGYGMYGQPMAGGYYPGYGMMPGMAAPGVQQPMPGQPPPQQTYYGQPGYGAFPGGQQGQPQQGGAGWGAFETAGKPAAQGANDKYGAFASAAPAAPQTQPAQMGYPQGTPMYPGMMYPPQQQWGYGAPMGQPVQQMVQQPVQQQQSYAFSAPPKVVEEQPKSAMDPWGAFKNAAQSAEKKVEAKVEKKTEDDWGEFTEGSAPAAPATEEKKADPWNAFAAAQVSAGHVASSSAADFDAWSAFAESSVKPKQEPVAAAIPEPVVEAKKEESVVQESANDEWGDFEESAPQIEVKAEPAPAPEPEVEVEVVPEPVEKIKEEVVPEPEPKSEPAQEMKHVEPQKPQAPAADRWAAFMSLGAGTANAFSVAPSIEPVVEKKEEPDDTWADFSAAPAPAQAAVPQAAPAAEYDAWAAFASAPAPAVSEPAQKTEVVIEDEMWRTFSDFSPPKEEEPMEQPKEDAFSAFSSAPAPAPAVPDKKNEVVIEDEDEMWGSFSQSAPPELKEEKPLEQPKTDDPWAAFASVAPASTAPEPIAPVPAPTTDVVIEDEDEDEMWSTFSDFAPPKEEKPLEQQSKTDDAWAAFAAAPEPKVETKADDWAAFGDFAAAPTADTAVPEEQPDLAEDVENPFASDSDSSDSDDDTFKEPPQIPDAVSAVPSAPAAQPQPAEPKVASIVAAKPDVLMVVGGDDDDDDDDMFFSDFQESTPEPQKLEPEPEPKLEPVKEAEPEPVKEVEPEPVTEEEEKKPEEAPKENDKFSVFGDFGGFDGPQLQPMVMSFNEPAQKKPDIDIFAMLQSNTQPTVSAADQAGANDILADFLGSSTSTATTTLPASNSMNFSDADLFGGFTVSSSASKTEEQDDFFSSSAAAPPPPLPESSSSDNFFAQQDESVDEDDWSAFADPEPKPAAAAVVAAVPVVAISKSEPEPEREEEKEEVFEDDGFLFDMLVQEELFEEAKEYMAYASKRDELVRMQMAKNSSDRQKIAELREEVHRFDDKRAGWKKASNPAKILDSRKLKHFRDLAKQDIDAAIAEYTALKNRPKRRDDAAPLDGVNVREVVGQALSVFTQIAIQTVEVRKRVLSNDKTRAYVKKMVTFIHAADEMAETERKCVRLLIDAMESCGLSIE